MTLELTEEQRRGVGVVLAYPQVRRDISLVERGPTLSEIEAATRMLWQHAGATLVSYVDRFAERAGFEERVPRDLRLHIVSPDDDDSALPAGRLGSLARAADGTPRGFTFRSAVAWVKSSLGGPGERRPHAEVALEFMGHELLHALFASVPAIARARDEHEQRSMARDTWAYETYEDTLVTGLSHALLREAWDELGAVLREQGAELGEMSPAAPAEAAGLADSYMDDSDLRGAIAPLRRGPDQWSAGAPQGSLTADVTSYRRTP
jgi:hypothetical protein